MKSPIQTLYYFQDDLCAYSSMIALSEKHWQSDLIRYKESLESGNDNNSFDGRRDLMAHLENEYPQIQRKALFVVLMTKFEDFLNQISISLQKQLELNISFSDITGQGIERIKRYIKLCTGIEFPADTKAWNAICDYQQIRNVIVHSDGHIHAENQKKAYDIISKTKNITIQQFARNHIALDPGFISDVITAFNEFIEKFSDRIGNRTTGEADASDPDKPSN
jgi:hypothetical protein